MLKKKKCGERPRFCVRRNMAITIIFFYYLKKKIVFNLSNSEIFFIFGYVRSFAMGACKIPLQGKKCVIGIVSL